MPKLPPQVKTVECACCYCAHVQAVPEPPSLHSCIACGRDFRVYFRRGSTAPMELGEAAKLFYKHQPKRSA